jgi:hypothetical protein
MCLKPSTSKKKDVLLFAVFVAFTVYTPASLVVTQCSLVQAASFVKED